MSQRLDGVKPTEAPPPALTKRQSELLLYCISHGYYTIPRRATLRTLSGQLGISTTSLSLALRRAEGKIIMAYASRLPVDPESLFPTVIGVEATYLDGFDDARQRGFQPIFEGDILRHEPPARLTRTAPPGGGL